MITPHDDFECILICLHHPLYVSVNFAAKGKKWCTLLSCYKFNDPDKHKESKTRMTIRFQMHHYQFSKCLYLLRCKELALFKADRRQLPRASKDEINLHRHIDNVDQLRIMMGCSSF